VGGNYFSAELTELNKVLTLVPTPLTAVTMTMLIPAAISAYSIAVAADSSARNLEHNPRMQHSF
jgi:hypothetical protein